MTQLHPEIDQRVVYGFIEECDWLTAEQQDDIVRLANDMGPMEQINVALARLTARALAHAVKNTLGESAKGAAPRAHVARHDSLARYGTGHPSEEPCIICGLHTLDIIDRHQTASGRPLCSRVCFDREARAMREKSTPVGVYEGDGHPAARAKYDPEPEGTEET